jgi:protein gp37
VSPGCLNCYAARMALRLERMGGSVGEKYEGTAGRARDGRPVFGGRVNLDWDAINLPRAWRKGRRIFVNSMSDLFHKGVPLDYIQQVFDVMRRAHWHRFQVLTKRAERLAELDPHLDWPGNVWMGVSVENSDHVDRIDHLRGTGARVKFLSLEPLLGPLTGLDLRGIHWAIVGGESGPKARPVEADWIRDIRDQCREAGVAFFFKQWGGRNKKKTGRLLDGRTWDEVPGSLSE